MFDGWSNPPEIEIFREVDRAVVVRSHEVFGSGAGAHQLSLAPRLAREHGLVVRSMHEGRQVAWVRLSTGIWVGVITLESQTADGLNSVSMNLWLQRHQFQLPNRDYR
ncbi:Uncharacterised protein [Mycobacteroides abscessus subsp. abscessus]|uniref:hypothetical protein n=1 Tax=Mycobacteroides abscessus TaxID=36809 RepID=UPI000925957D|nr:hypothetical protein [Mycobacteroides abscessus]SIM08772.1 Uncharacterised protein [Mycobacteroides abscessus subsp. abscessus]